MTLAQSDIIADVQLVYSFLLYFAVVAAMKGEIISPSTIYEAVKLIYGLSKGQDS
jgi:hypothetical protein